MATTGRLYATTPAGAATGAPNGVGATVPAGGSGLTLGGFGIQAAIGSEPGSIDGITVGIVARMSAPNDVYVQLLHPGAQSKLWLPVGVSYAEATGSAPALAWSVLPNVTVKVNADAYVAVEVDAVWVEVAYTPATVDHPMAGSVPTITTVTGALTPARPLDGTIPALSGVSGLLGVLPAGLEEVVPVVSTVSGSLGTIRTLAGTVDATTTTSGTVAKVEIRVIAEPARTVDQLVRGSHRRTDHVIILNGERAGERLPIIGGDLTLDEAADVRATGTLHLPPLAWLAYLLDPLTTRTELAVVLSIRGDDDVEHTWQRAVVHATEMPVQVTSEQGLSLSVQVADRSDWVRKTGMREHYAGRGDVTIMEHAVRLVGLRAPWLPLGDITDPGFRSGSDLAVGGLGEDPWQQAVRLAWSVGQRLYVDAYGRLASQPVLMDDSIDARWVAGEDECLVASMSTSRSDADVCNVLGVPWEEARPDDAPTDWTPLGGVEWWEDTDGPLGTRGPLGERVRAYTGDTSVIHSAGHARDVAYAHGVTQAGARLPLDFAARCDPRLDVGSVVLVERPELAISERCRVSMLTFELGAALMSGSMGERRIT